MAVFATTDFSTFTYKEKPVPSAKLNSISETVVGGLASVTTGKDLLVPSVNKDITTTNYVGGPGTVYGGNISGCTGFPGVSSNANQITSGLANSDGYPNFLSYTGITATIEADSTDFVYIANSKGKTLTANVTFTGLTTAPSTNNTCASNDAAYADDAFTKTEGEFGETYLTIDAAGSEITDEVGYIHPFKHGANPEIFWAYINSATKLESFKRGICASGREEMSEDDTITLLIANHLFINADGTTTYSTTKYPVFADVAPTSPSNNDFFYNTTLNVWQRYEVSAWVTKDALWIGSAICDDTEVIGVEYQHFYKGWSSDIDVNVKYVSATKVNVVINKLSVAGETLSFYSNYGQEIDLSEAGDRETDVSEAVSTLYFIYVDTVGKAVFSDICPRGRDLRGGLYHPNKYWRCVGSVYNDSSGDIVPFIYGDGYCEYIPNGTGAADAVNSDYILTSSINTTYTFYSSETIPPYAIKGIIAVSVDANLEASANVYFYTKKRGQTYGNPEVTTSGGDSGSGVSTIKGGFVYSQNGTFICRVSADNGYLNYKGYEVKY